MPVVFAHCSLVSQLVVSRVGGRRGAVIEQGLRISHPDRGFSSRLADRPRRCCALDLLPLRGNLMCAEAAHRNFRDGIQQIAY